MAPARTALAALLAAAVACVLGGTAAQAQAADRDAAPALVGKAKTRHGEITLRFTTDPGWMVIRVDRKGARHAKGSVITVQCRTENGSYKTVAGIVWTSTQRGTGGPAALPENAAVCRIRRGSATWATMRMRQTRDT